MLRLSIETLKTICAECYGVVVDSAELAEVFQQVAEWPTRFAELSEVDSSPVETDWLERWEG
jgi:hypothetical protein